MNIVSMFANYGFLLTIAFLLTFVFAICLHEWAHAITATKLGDDTPRLNGRTTLDPRAHIDPIGAIMFLLFGFGWGKPVIYNPLRLRSKWSELWIALAGPAINLIAALICNLLVIGLIALATQTGSAPTALTNFIAILQLVASINVMLAAFNLLPIPPLDGSSIIAVFWPQYRSMFAGQLGLFLLLALIFIPVNGGNILSNLINPLTHLFSIITLTR